MQGWGTLAERPMKSSFVEPRPRLLHCILRRLAARQPQLSARGAGQVPPEALVIQLTDQ